MDNSQIPNSTESSFCKQKKGEMSTVLFEKKKKKHYVSAYLLNEKNIKYNNY